MDHPDTIYFDDGIDFSQPQLYGAARAPLGVATMLPRGAYTSEVFQRLENEKVWTREWVCIGTTPQIENPFDLLPYTIGNHAIHVQRMADGSLVGRFNKAQHGGCRTVPVQCQTGRKTSCSYTSCGFSRDRDVIPGSSLQEMSPQMGQYLGMRPERLLPVKLATSGPLLFANIDPTPGVEPPAALPEVGDHVVRRDGRWQEHRSNWKLAGASIVDAASWGLDDGSVEWVFPNLVIVRSRHATLAVVLQPTAMEQTLWRLSFFAAPGVQQVAYEAARDELLRRLDEATAAAEALQVAIERAPAGGGPEAGNTAWLFNHALSERITRQHESYWNAPLMRA
ncbi:MAG: ring-hydroxylating oxygenase subunit alpha [Bauldia sp.]|nr:ring-hydroxylating oxygenase subunit alpha [Bauldia sp.]